MRVSTNQGQAEWLLTATANTLRRLAHAQDQFLGFDDDGTRCEVGQMLAQLLRIGVALGQRLLFAGQLAFDFSDETVEELLVEPEFQLGAMQRCQQADPVPFLHGRLQSIGYCHTTLFRQPLKSQCKSFNSILFIFLFN